MPGELSSDVLERQFGPTLLEILRQDDTGRVIATKTADGSQVLELSQVSFRPEGIAAFAGIHRKVMDGASMGKAFREAGIAFKRQVRGVHRPDSTPPVFSQRFGAAGPPTVIDVSILAGPGETPYADILEVYGPAVSWDAAAAAPDREITERLHAFGGILAESRPGHTA